MVYLLHSHFGKDGREEADELLERRSGDVDRPRILNTFNEPIDDWLSFYMFTNFTDRDGKYQLLALAESAFDPLARTCRFMLTEEAHHMFVGVTGVDRVVTRSCELMNEFSTEDIGKHGGVPLALLQKYINFWYSSSVDLFGAEKSTNAAAYFAAGLKGRAYEAKRYDEHTGAGVYTMDVPDGDRITSEEVAMRNAMNEVLRDGYIEENLKSIEKWNRTLAKHNVDFEFTLPHRRFNRTVGHWSEVHFDLKGNIITEAEWNKNKYAWIPSDDDKAFVKTLMKQVTEPGKIAGWVAPPPRGINNHPFDYEYVKL